LTGAVRCAERTEDGELRPAMCCLALAAAMTGTLG
jgi:hypothetical protein